MAQNPGNDLRELLVLNRAVKSVRELSPSSTKSRERSPRAPGSKLSSHKYSAIRSQTTGHRPMIQKAMASQTFSFAVVLVVALFFAVASAQDLSPAPAPGPDAGAAGSVSSSMAVIGASVVLSMLAIFKH
ncbi:hypothetical protein VIGAN_07154300 [Vigna angularis var. angularis]|uniref:Uncharacterized protein n=2 Tax=Phaseolus angularis TaxID=3914 RepID=A0A0S3SIQ1_PHAAN|nr:hypothetical protein VIGAN_07154300 [Vigna angularis var. angularis]